MPIKDPSIFWHTLHVNAFSGSSVAFAAAAASPLTDLDPKVVVVVAAAAAPVEVDDPPLAIKLLIVPSVGRLQVDTLVSRLK
jgi:hypothetical protein